MARVPALGTRAGAGTGLVQLVVVVVALLLDLGRVRRPAPLRPDPQREASRLSRKSSVRRSTTSQSYSART